MCDVGQIKVNGSGTHPVFQFLKQALPGLLGEVIAWLECMQCYYLSLLKRNFSKFLCDFQGRPFRRYGPKDAPFSFEDDIRLPHPPHCTPSHLQRLAGCGRAGAAGARAGQQVV